MQFADFARQLPEYITHRAQLSLEDIDDASMETTGRATYRTGIGFTVQIERGSERHHDLEVVLRMDLAKFSVNTEGELQLSLLLLEMNTRLDPNRLSLDDTNTVRILQNFKVEALPRDTLSLELDTFLMSALFMTDHLFEYRDLRRKAGAEIRIFSPDHFAYTPALKRDLPHVVDGASALSPWNDVIALAPVKKRSLRDIQDSVDAEIQALGSDVPGTAFATRMTALVDALHHYTFEFDITDSVALRLTS